ncbi:carboxypeptidase-like regulatory domain-containing protein [Granulicella sp. dw_53]|uniref:carboxypeptidase-like regulatory domain-containing protein n=1 Tax=Granulicella sp. dw_53 TaxID=2719792 RepID=UPI001BD4AED4|nr:carboxypeptidase-like regulatory domain-containing protein [Granulicella sp. dw_53]
MKRSEVGGENRSIPATTYEPDNRTKGCDSTSCLQTRPATKPLSSHRFKLSLLSLTVLLSALVPALTRAEQTPLLPTAQNVLPEAPGRSSAIQSTDQLPTGSITGIVLDIRQGLVADARITLIPQAGLEERVITSDSDGSFTFTNVPPGTYKVKISSPGLETLLTSDIQIRGGERHELPSIALPVAANAADVTVTVTQQQLAEEQINAEIKQRVLGVFPNFYTSFIWNAAPLSPRQKFKLAIRSTTDPIAFATTSIIAGEEQARGKYKGYGDGAEGFGKRYGAAYGDIFIGRIIGSAILPTLFRQDPRYFYRGSGTVPSRAFYAIRSAFICRGNNGRWQPNYSHVLGNFAAGGISNLYRPDEDRGARLAIDNALLHTAGNAVANLVREFVLRGVTSKVPDYANGKDEAAPKNRP